MRNKIFFVIVIVIIIIVFGFLYSDEKNKEDVSCRGCNLIMISLSNVSAKHMSLYGYERLTTPRLDEWAKDAIVFENAFTQTSWTLPVAVSLFTSLYPYTHQITDTHKTGRFVATGNALARNIVTLPEILRDEGYKTAAFTGGLDYNNTFGHLRGFETLWGASDEAPDYETAISRMSMGPALENARSWLEENRKEKFFLFVHGYDTHCPIVPPEHVRGTFSTREGKDITVDDTRCVRAFGGPGQEDYEAYYHLGGDEKIFLTKDDMLYLEELYDEEILSLDMLVGRFLDEVENMVGDDTVIVVFSDHGEMFAKNGRFGRAGRVRGTLYDEALHIPLVVKTPGHKGGTVEGLSQIIDVMPTVLDMLELERPARAQGKSLISLMKGERESVNDDVFAGSRFGVMEERSFFLVYPYQSISESVRSREWKLIHEVIFDEEGGVDEDIYELYDLRDDPQELNNVFSSKPAVAASMAEVLESWRNAAKQYSGL